MCNLSSFSVLAYARHTQTITDLRYHYFNVTDMTNPDEFLLKDYNTYQTFHIVGISISINN